MPPAAKDPTHAELAGMVKVGQIFDWLKADSALSGAILAGMGLTSESHPRAYADIDEDDVKQQKSAIKIGESALNPAQKGMLGASWRIARLIVGDLKTAEQIAAEAKAAKEDEEKKLDLIRAQTEAAKVQATAAAATTAIAEKKLTDDDGKKRRR